jgi:hypothetical protein
MLDPYVTFITETLEQFPTLTAARLFDMAKALTLVRADQTGTQPPGQKTKAPSDAFKSEWLSKSANTYRTGCSPTTRTSSKPSTPRWASDQSMSQAPNL